jgi:predicted amidohydrolase YtcJ
MAAELRVLGATLLLLTGWCTPREPVDLVLHNGVVFTADQAQSVQSAVAIRDGRIVAVGGNEVRRRFEGARTIDLGGRLVTPGFNDSHIHVMGFPRSYVDLAHAQSIAEIQELVRSKAAELGPGEWVTGMGWAEGLVAEGRPMPGLYAATTRKGASGRVYAADEALTMAEAIAVYTRNSAFITREEASKGTIEPGRLADLVVLSRNLLEIPPEEILETVADVTILGGRIVFERTEKGP